MSEGPAAREALAREVSSPEALADGRAKLLLTAVGLRLRRKEPRLFLAGDHLPLACEGRDAAHVVAFARVKAEGDRQLLCVAPRLLLGLLDAGGGTIDWDGRLLLPPSLAERSDPFIDVVTGRALMPRAGALSIGELLAAFPTALLIR